MLQFNFLVNSQKPWNVDFRDNALITNSMYNTIKSSSMILLTVLTLLLSICCIINFFSLRSKKQKLVELQQFISTNNLKHKKAIETNREFVTLSNKLTEIINNYQTSFDPLYFLKEIMLLKTNNTKLSTLIVQSPTIIPVKIPLLIQLYGTLNDDISYLDNYNASIMKFSSLKTLKEECKSFFQFDQSQTPFNSNEVKFQLTIQ